jgi:homoaconitase/3-isopropylmalate dehydratase large subunit
VFIGRSKKYKRMREMIPKTLYEKLWDMHEVTQMKDGNSLLYIDRHILYYINSFNFMAVSL